MHDKEAKVRSKNGSCEYTQTSSTGHAARDKIDKDTAVGKEHYTKVFSLIVFNHFIHASNFVTCLREAEKFVFMFTAKIISVKTEIINRNKTYADIGGKL